MVKSIFQSDLSGNTIILICHSEAAAFLAAEDSVRSWIPMSG